MKARTAVSAECFDCGYHAARFALVKVAKVHYCNDHPIDLSKVGVLFQLAIDMLEEECQQSERGREESLKAIVAENIEKAAAEEMGGCCGAAEVLLKKALHMAALFFPEDKLTARAASAFGELQSRFLPQSRQPAEYFRISFNIQKLLNPSSVDTFRALLRFAESLISCGECEQAESILRCVSSDGTQALQASIYLGRVALVRGDILKAEERLRRCVQSIRETEISDCELLGEALTVFGEILLEKEEFEECESVLLEAIRLQRTSVGRKFHQAVRFYFSLCNKSRLIAKRDAMLEDLLTQFNTKDFPYLAAEILTNLAEAYFESDVASMALAIQYYQQAICIYRNVKRTTWYVAILSCKIMRAKRETSLAVKMLGTVSKLPSVSLMFSVAFERDSTCVLWHWPSWKKAARNISEPFIDAEAIARFFPLCTCLNEKKCVYGMNTFGYRFISHNFLLKLLCESFAIKLMTAKGLLCFVEEMKKSIEKREGINSDVLLFIAKVYEHHVVPAPSVRIPTARPSRKDSKVHEDTDYKRTQDCLIHALQCSFELNPMSYAAARALFALGKFFERRSHALEAEALFHQTLTVLSKINPHSNRAAKMMLFLAQFYARGGRNPDAEVFYNKALETLLRINPLSGLSKKAVMKVRYWLTVSTSQRDKLLQFSLRYFSVLKELSPADELFFEELNKVTSMCDLNTKLCLYKESLRVLMKYQSRTLGKSRKSISDAKGIISTGFYDIYHCMNRFQEAEKWIIIMKRGNRTRWGYSGYSSSSMPQIIRAMYDPMMDTQGYQMSKYTRPITRLNHPHYPGYLSIGKRAYVLVEPNWIVLTK